MPEKYRPMTISTRNEPRVFSTDKLKFRANSPKSRSARAVTEETTGATKILSGVFFSEPGSEGGWSFGDSDPHVERAPWVGAGEEVYFCIQGRVEVEWEGGSFEFGAGDIVFWPNNSWFRTRIIGDEPAQIFYCMAPPPTHMWSLGDSVTKAGKPDK